MDGLNDCLSILVSEIITVPFLFHLSEVRPDLPNLVSDIEVVLELLHLWNFCLLDLECALVSQVLVELSDTLIILLSDLACSVKSFFAWSISSHEFLICGKILDQLFDFFLFLKESFLEILDVSFLFFEGILLGLSQIFCGQVEISLQLINPSLKR